MYGNTRFFDESTDSLSRSLYWLQFTFRDENGFGAPKYPRY